MSTQPDKNVIVSVSMRREKNRIIKLINTKHETLGAIEVKMEIEAFSSLVLSGSYLKYIYKYIWSTFFPNPKTIIIIVILPTV